MYFMLLKRKIVLGSYQITAKLHSLMNIVLIKSQLGSECRLLILEFYSFLCIQIVYRWLRANKTNSGLKITFGNKKSGI